MSKKHRSSFSGKVGANAKEKKREASSYGYLALPDGIKLYKPEPGKRAFIDIIPYEITDEKHPDRNDQNEIAMVGDLWYKRPFKIHRNVGVDNDTVICPISFGKPCPVCEYQKELRDKNGDKEEIKSLYPRSRSLYVIVPINSKEYDEEAHIMDLSDYNFQNMLYDEIEEGNIPEDFCDLESGCTLKVRFSSEKIGKGDPFAQASRIDAEERQEQYTEDILDDVPNLDEVLIVLPYKQLQAKFLEIDSEEDTDTDNLKSDEDDEPRTRRKKTTRSRSRSDEEEEEEPRSRTKRKSTRKRDEEEEEEEEKPKRRGMLIRDREEEEESKGRREHRSSRNRDSENQCPFKHEFGVDTDQFDDCNDCKVWKDCDEEYVKSKR